MLHGDRRRASQLPAIRVSTHVCCLHHNSQLPLARTNCGLFAHCRGAPCTQPSPPTTLVNVNHPEFTTIYAIDLSPSSETIYNLNHPQTTLDCRPLDQVPLTSLPTVPIELLTGGFPCQPCAGLADHRADVFEHIMRVAQHLQPRWVLLENVANLARLEDGHVLQRVQPRSTRGRPRSPTCPGQGPALPAQLAAQVNTVQHVTAHRYTTGA